MPSLILTDTVASLAELKEAPLETFSAADGHAIAILDKDKPAFYCVSPELYEYFMELAEDAELSRIVEERQHEEPIPVELESLRR